MKQEMKGCPFCGASPKLVQHTTTLWSVECDDCNAGSGWAEDIHSPAEAWNRRAPDARDARIAELEAELAALKSPAPIPPNSTELAPSTPWYPDDSGEWVEVPDDLMEMPRRLKPSNVVQVLFREEREGEYWSEADHPANVWCWAIPFEYATRIVAYKVVKP